MATSFMPPQPLRERKAAPRAGMDGMFHRPQSGRQLSFAAMRLPAQEHSSYPLQTALPGRNMDDALYCQIRQLERREEQSSFAIIDSQSMKTSAHLLKPPEGANCLADIGYAYVKNQSALERRTSFGAHKGRSNLLNLRIGSKIDSDFRADALADPAIARFEVSLAQNLLTA